jgi:uncharacterized phage-associated protein
MSLKICFSQLLFLILHANTRIMCRFSEPNRQKLGNTVLYIAQHAKYPYKTEILKLLFLMEERMVQQYHVPMLAIPYSVWRLGPVSVDVFEELSDGPVLLSEFIALEFNGQGIKVTPKRDFCDDEFSDAELQVMAQVMEKYGSMTSDQLIDETHKPGSLWYDTAKEYDLLDDFEQKRANSSNIVIDMARHLCPDHREYYEEILENRQMANLLRK